MSTPRRPESDNIPEAARELLNDFHAAELAIEAEKNPARRAELLILKKDLAQGAVKLLEVEQK